jgi:hypothetical protein
LDDICCFLVVSSSECSNAGCFSSESVAVNPSGMNTTIVKDITCFGEMVNTYDHRLRRIGHPVRSAIHKPQIGRLVVGWVTTSEYLLLYVFGIFL